MIDWIKNNPIKTVALVVLFIVIYMMMSGGSSTSSSTSSGTTGTDPSLVQAGMQLQAAQMQQQGQLAALATQAGAQADQTAAAVTIAQLQSHTAEQQNTLSANVAVHSLDVQQQIATSANSLQAAIAANQAYTTTQIAGMQATTNQAMINASTEQARISADTNRQLIDSNTQISLGAQKTTVDVAQINKPKKGLCFVTSACCAALSLDDDCFDLRMLRRLRDEYVALLPDGPELMAEYADKSPAMIAAVDNADDQAAAWLRVYTAYIHPAAHAVERGDMEDAYTLYRAMVVTLERETGGNPI